MRRIGFALAGALLWAIAAVPQDGDDKREIFREIGSVSEGLAQISGLRLHKAVPYDLITKEKVGEFLKTRMKEVTTVDELRAEELTLKKFGLVPQDFDLAKNTVELVTEQAAAFYDYHKKKLYITDWTPSSSREGALVHELAHAVADQNFNLDRYIRKGQKNDDGSTARLAVMEGQASWLMAEYLAHKVGQSLKTSESLLRMMSRSSEGSGDFPVFENAPLYMRESLVFPYTKGMLFQHAVVMKMDKAGFAEVFRRAPASTQQILHPEKYFENVQPTRPALPPLDKAVHGFKPLVEGTVGEFDHQILIRQFADREKAESLAPHWKGAAFRLVEDKGRTRTILLYSVEWDTETSAQEYFAFYRTALQKKWNRMEVRGDQPDTLTGIGDDGRFVVRRVGTVVSSVEGMP